MIRIGLSKETYIGMMDPEARATAAARALRGLQPGDGGRKRGFPPPIPAQRAALLPWRGDVHQGAADI